MKAVLTRIDWPKASFKLTKSEDKPEQSDPSRTTDGAAALSPGPVSRPRRLVAAFFSSCSIRASANFLSSQKRSSFSQALTGITADRL